MEFEPAPNQNQNRSEGETKASPEILNESKTSIRIDGRQTNTHQEEMRVVRVADSSALPDLDPNVEISSRDPVDVDQPVAGIAKSQPTWSTHHSRELYGLQGWGNDYFHISASHRGCKKYGITGKHTQQLRHIWEIKNTK